MISHEHRCIFVHIPKTGGSSVENILWPKPRSTDELWMGFISKYENKYHTGGLQHLYARFIRQEVGPKIFDKYFKFAFVRNPWDRLVSQYSYMPTRPDLMDFVGMKSGDSFKKYLDLILRKKHVQWTPQHEFLTDESGKSIIDYIARFENFDSDMQTLMKKLSLSPVTIPHANKSNRGTYQSYFDSESIEMVENYYSVDINMYGYTYNNLTNN